MGAGEVALDAKEGCLPTGVGGSFLEEVTPKLKACERLRQALFWGDDGQRKQRG